MRAVERRSVRAIVPDLVYGEVTYAVLRYLRGERLEQAEAAAIVETIVALPLRAEPLRGIAPAALTVALERQISAYDACYVALAEAERAVLVTADRELAQVYEPVELIT